MQGNLGLGCLRVQLNNHVGAVVGHQADSKQKVMGS